MMLRNNRELVRTKEKLRLLEATYAEVLSESDDDDSGLRAAELWSLKKLMNQFTEEIVRYEAHRGVRPEAAMPLQPSAASASSNSTPS